MLLKLKNNKFYLLKLKNSKGFFWKEIFTINSQDIYLKLQEQQ